MTYIDKYNWSIMALSENDFPEEFNDLTFCGKFIKEDKLDEHISNCKTCQNQIAEIKEFVELVNNTIILPSLKEQKKKEKEGK